MAALTPVTIVRSASGLLTMASASAGGDEFANTGKEILLIENTGSPARTLTVTTEETIDGEAVADKDITIAANSIYAIGPWPTGIYNDVDGNVNISYDSETNLEVAVIKYG